MEFQYTSAPVTELDTDLLALSVFSGQLREGAFRELDDRLGGALTRQASRARFTGKRGQQLSIHPVEGVKTRHILVLGAGDPAAFELPEVRNLAAIAARQAGPLGATSMSFVVPVSSETDLGRASQLAAEGALLGSYRFDKYLTGDNRPAPPARRVELVVPGLAEARRGAKKSRRAALPDSLGEALERARAVAEAVMLARDLVNEPAAFMTPRQLATEAQRVARRHKLGLKVLGPKECERLGMGMFLAVGQGSDEEVRLVHLTYRPRGTPRRRIALIGKGVTFDSGGYSLKPSQSMEDMKVDMSGAATVIATMGAVAALESPDEVHAVAACAENLVSGNAYKLGDVLRSMSGTTVEITNTDAEGRLTLGDAITYAKQKVRPDEILDFATLTGACVVALGPHVAGVLSNHEATAERWLAAARRAGEDMWRLPLSERLREQLKSGIADLKNTGERWGGAITAGLFLKTFVGDTPWVHVDFAGPASASKESGATPKGGTGFGVASILEYLTS